MGKDSLVAAAAIQPKRRSHRAGLLPKLRRIPVRRFSVLLALLPVTATVFGLLFLNQVPSITDLIGISFVLIGVVVQQRDTLPATEVVA